MRVLLVSANREMLPSPVVPIGPLAVASALRDTHEVELTDLCFEEDPLAAIERAVRDVDPEVIGLGLRNLHTNAYDGMEGLILGYVEVVRSFRDLTDVPIVLGGAAYSLQPETLLGRLGADYGVVGEGERAFRDIVDGLARGALPARVTRAEASAGLVTAPLVRRGPNGRSSDLDELPLPARDLVD